MDDKLASDLAAIERVEREAFKLAAQALERAVERLASARVSLIDRSVAVDYERFKIDRPTSTSMRRSLDDAQKRCEALSRELKSYHL